MKKTILITFLIITFFSSYSQEMSILDYFSILPTEAFDYTTDGISNMDKEELIHTGLTDIWKITEKSKTGIEISGGDQRITLILLKTNESPIIIVYTENAQVTLIHTWVYNMKNESFIRKSLLPQVSINDFYSKEDALSNPEKYYGNVSFYLNSEGKILASIYTWMETELENKKIKFDIYIKWVNDKFEINKKLK